MNFDFDSFFKFLLANGLDFINMSKLTASLSSTLPCTYTKNTIQICVLLNNGNRTDSSALSNRVVQTFESQYLILLYNFRGGFILDLKLSSLDFHELFGCPDLVSFARCKSFKKRISS